MNFTIWLGDSRCVVYRQDYGIVINEHSPLTQNGRIANTQTARNVFAKVLKELDTRRNSRFAFLTPVDLEEHEFASFKQVAYTSGVQRAVFVPMVSWVASTYGRDNCLVIFIGHEGADIAVVSGGKIIRSLRTKGASKEAVDAVQMLGLTEMISPAFNHIISKVNAMLKSCEPEILANIVKGNILISVPFINIPGLKQFFLRELQLDVEVVDCFPDVRVKIVS